MVNINQNNGCMHALLQKNNNTHILIVQEPCYYTIATVHSDNDPEGLKQKNIPHNNMWDTHLPKHGSDNTCKVTIYTKKMLLRMHTVRLRYDHPLASLTLMVMDITNANNMTLHIINTYHVVPSQGHSLHYLISHSLDKTVPTLLIRDLNTHDL